MSSLKGIFRLRILTVMLLAVFSLTTPTLLTAAEHKVGPYTVDVDVRSSLMQVIPHAYVKCRLSGNTIKISASAPGYVAQTHEFAAKPGQLVYPVIIRLPDKKVSLEVMTFDYKPIVSAYFDRYQGGTPTDLYAINLYLPIKSWPHPKPSNLKVNQPGYGWPIQQTCDISVFADFYQVRMLVNRAVLDDPKDQLLVYVNTSEEISVAAAENWLLTLQELEESNRKEAEQLAIILAAILPVAEFSVAPLPRSIAAAVAFKRRFAELHRD
ncbi:MAG: hypothetical protein CVV42_00460 [Candidatus Riflebacteria bacterium HGW-Riflebacteria-2]|jgi:hypothetical protein|nr:MAG: hypothetical protein CVV42_00460 [Candidatus Riflebacteria bacterium HGW-Riflebacteria-2]